MNSDILFNPPTEGEERVKAIVLRRVAYKESDAVLTALSQSRLFSFYGKGVNRLSSKNGPSVSDLCLSLFLFHRSSQGKLSLREGRVCENLAPYGDLDSLSVAMFAQEAGLRLLNEDSSEGECSFAFDAILGALRSLKGGLDPYLAGIGLCSSFLSLAGWTPEVESCVRCGKRQGICAISVEDGGFVCRDCLRQADIRRPKEFLSDFQKAIRDPKSLEKAGHDRELFSLLASFLASQGGFKFKSVALLGKL